jgi:two-component system cell cycle response regulator
LIVNSDKVSPTSQALLENEIIIIDDIVRLPEFKEKSTLLSAGIHSTISLPINVKSRDFTFGVMTLLMNQVHVFKKEELDLFQNIMETVGFGVELIDNMKERERLIKELEIEASTDSLTKCKNRRKGRELLERETQRCKRYGRHASLIFFDIDNFKYVNDTYGHNKGDMVLVTILNTVKNLIRSSDICIRWGGEEFIIVLPETKLENALFLAQKICNEIAKSNTIENHNVTASFGVTEYTHNETIDSFVKRADKLMYKAKQSGKNRVVSV